MPATIISLLITGATHEKRQEKALAKLSDYQITDLDTLKITGENSIGINKVRELEKWSSRKPNLGENKAAIILEAEKLTLASQNALLKTLEEPPNNTLIILTATKETLLLKTITSRCQIIKLQSESKTTLSKAQVTQILNDLTTLLKKSPGERIQKAENYSKTREEALVFLDQLIFALRSSLLEKRKTPSIIRSALQAREMIEKNTNTRLVLENFLLDLPTV